MQRLIRLWGKDHVINVGQRANLYKTIKRLNEAGLIAVRQTERNQQYPERTIYELTDAGRTTAREWLTEHAGRPPPRVPAVPGGASFVMLLSRQAARRRWTGGRGLRERLTELEQDLEPARSAAAGRAARRRYRRDDRGSWPGSTA